MPTPCIYPRSDATHVVLQCRWCVLHAGYGVGGVGVSAGMRMALRETERPISQKYTMPVIMASLHVEWVAVLIPSVWNVSIET